MRWNPDPQRSNMVLGPTWLEHSGSVPIHIHLGWSVDTEDVTGSLISQIEKVLLPHVTRIASLDFPYWSSFTLVNAIFKLCDSQEVQSLKSLGLDIASGYIEPIPWSIQSLRGLVNLKLRSIHASTLKMDDLALAMSNSPGLRLIELLKLHIEQGSNHHLPIVNLPDLRFLSLREINPKALTRLLSLVSPGNYGLHFEVEVYDSPTDVVDSITLFMSKAHIVSIVLWDIKTRNISLMERYFSSLTSLRNMILNTMHDRDKVDITGTLESLMISSHDGRTPRFPALEVFVLAGFTLYDRLQDKIKEFIQIHSLRALGLSRGVVSSAQGYTGIEAPAVVISRWAESRGVSDILNAHDSTILDNRLSGRLRNRLLGMGQWG
ncbi:hypothetical protein RhiJN_17271 [Ceratobasidium sp. AG-Ba]|nr:hypothetical protein RhiJN_17271 [Ceratobasidium sp. AG-Ba]